MADFRQQARQELENEVAQAMVDRNALGSQASEPPPVFQPGFTGALAAALQGPQAVQRQREFTFKTIQQRQIAIQEQERVAAQERIANARIVSESSRKGKEWFLRSLQNGAITWSAIESSPTLQEDVIGAVGRAPEISLEIAKAWFDTAADEKANELTRIDQSQQRIDFADTQEDRISANQQRRLTVSEAELTMRAVNQMDPGGGIESITTKQAENNAAMAELASALKQLEEKKGKKEHALWFTRQEKAFEATKVAFRGRKEPRTLAEVRTLLAAAQATDRGYAAMLLDLEEFGHIQNINAVRILRLMGADNDDIQAFTGVEGGSPVGIPGPRPGGSLITPPGAQAPGLEAEMHQRTLDALKAAQDSTGG